MLKYKLSKQYIIKGYYNEDNLVLDIGGDVNSYLMRKGLSTNMEHRVPEKNRIGFKDASGVEGKVVIFRSRLSRRKIRLNARIKFPNSTEKQASDILSYLAAYVPFSKS